LKEVLVAASVLSSALVLGLEDVGAGEATARLVLVVGVETLSTAETAFELELVLEVFEGLAFAVTGIPHTLGCRTRARFLLGVAVLVVDTWGGEVMRADRGSRRDLGDHG